MREPAERYRQRAARLHELQADFERTGRYAAASYTDVEAVGLEDYNLALLLSTVIARHRFEILERLLEFYAASCQGPPRLLSVGYGTGLELYLASQACRSGASRPTRNPPTRTPTPRTC